MIVEAKECHGCVDLTENFKTLKLSFFRLPTTRKKTLKTIYPIKPRI